MSDVFSVDQIQRDNAERCWQIGPARARPRRRVPARANHDPARHHSVVLASRGHDLVGTAPLIALRSERLVAEINRLDLRHRKGWRPSDFSGASGVNLVGEAEECRDAILEDDRLHILEEMGDVLACILQIAFRKRFSFDEIEKEAERKLRLRFDGAAEIAIEEHRTPEHHCHAPGCTIAIPAKLHMCKRHWFMLPKAFRDEIWRTYRPGQEIDKRPNAEYLAAFEKSTAFIRAAEAMATA